MHRLRGLLACLLLAAAAGPAVASGWLDAMRQRLMPQPAAETTTLPQVLEHIRSLPASERFALAAEAGEEGHWRLYNRSGEPCSAANPDEVTRCLASLLPAAAATSASAPLAFYLTADSLFRHRGALAALPPRSRLHMVLPSGAFRLLPAGRSGVTGQRYFAEMAPKLALEVTGQAEFAEARRQLARPTRSLRWRLVGLEPGVKPGFAPARAAAAERPVHPLDPDALRHAFFAFRGELVLMVGRFAGERLVYQPASGPERSLLIRDFTAAAAASDADLLLLGSPSARQPGTRNWLWLATGVAGLEASLKSATLGEALTSLVGGGDGVAVTMPAPADGSRLRLVAERLQRVESTSTLTTLGDILADLVSPVTTSTQATRAELHTATTAHRQELAARLVPGIPAPVQAAYLVALLLALPGLGLLRRWYALAWPPEQRADYGSSPAFWAAVAVRLGLFCILFAPLLGVWATVWSLASLRSRDGPPARPEVGAGDRTAP